MGEWKHRMIETDPESMTGVCSHCGPVKVRRKKGYLSCAVSEARWGDNRKLKKFGLDAKGYEKLLSDQGGVCAICLLPPAEDRRLAVDHCHSGGQVRGLLCHRCNMALGLMNDNKDALARAVAYLETQP